jgi:hypothetical protein
MSVEEKPAAEEKAAAGEELPVFTKTLGDQVFVHRLDHRIALPIPFALLRSGGNASNKIQTRGLKRSHVQSLKESIKKNGFLTTTNVLVRRVCTTVTKAEYTRVLSLYGNEHVAAVVPDRTFAVNPEAGIEVVPLSPVYARCLVPTSGAVIPRATNPTQDALVESNVVYNVFYYDVFDGNHRVSSVQDLIKEGFHVDYTNFMVSCVVYKSSMPDELCEGYSSHINDVQAVARANSYADVMLWVKKNYASVIASDTVTKDMIAYRDEQRSKVKQSRVQAKMEAKYQHKLAVTLVQANLTTLMKAVAGYIQPTSAAATKAAGVSLRARVSISGFSTWGVIASLNAVQNVRWTEVCTPESTIPIDPVFIERVRNNSNYAFPVNQPALTAKFVSILEVNGSFAVASSKEILANYDLLMAFHLGFAAWRCFYARSTDRVTMYLGAMIDFLGKPAGKAAAAQLGRDLAFLRTMQFEAHPQFVDDSMPASLRSSLADDDTTRVHHVFSCPVLAGIAFLMAAAIVHDVRVRLYYRLCRRFQYLGSDNRDDFQNRL